MASTNPMSKDTFMYQVHHIFLPPKLPQSDDFEASHEHELLNDVLLAMERFKGYLDGSRTFEAAIGMVRAMIDCRSGSYLNAESVSAALRDMDDGGSLGLHIRSQNFGLLVSRRGDTVRFEGFELLAENCQVMKCKGRLRRRFPNTCVEVDLHQFSIPSFLDMLGYVLGQLDVTTHASCRPKVTKANKEQDEERDTVDPRLLGLVTGLLRGLGRQGKCNQILKHSREEVLWHDASLPWHRSAGWLFLRVSLQLVLDRECEAGQGLFKQFMAFLTGTMLQQGISMTLPSHLLQCMLAKVNRRHLKLLTVPEVKAKPRWLSHTLGMMQQASSRLQETWSLIQKKDARTFELSSLKSLQFDTDTYLSLSSLKPHLDSVSDPNRYTSSRTATDLLNAGFSFQQANPHSLPNPSFDGRLDNLFELADFEHWVAENLEAWSIIHATHSSTCQQLSRLIESYQSTASKAYENNPINLSIMWLTIVELWVVLDTSVVSSCPLLLDHKVGFPMDLLEPLILPTKTQMARLRKLEGYLSNREGQANAHYPSAFGGFGNPQSFATRFYNGSERHQTLHRQILQLAERRRVAKLHELESSKSTYNSLKYRHDNATHDEYEVETSMGWERKCQWDCFKCRLSAEMIGMSISVHEWPLPEREHESSAVVFELQVPDFIVCWRRITMELLTDMLTEWEGPIHGEKTYYVLEYSDLVPFASRGGRLQLGSTAKPFTVAHYSHRPLSVADTSNVCQNHGCRYEYYDKEKRAPTSSLSGKPAVPQNCSFAHLSNFTPSQWISGYGHSSNEVVAQQFMSPQHMTLNEFKVFGHLRSGVRLQWRNILTQLMIPSLDLNKIDTAILFLQASYHAGPDTDDAPSIYRDAHAVLADEEFGRSFLGALRTTLARVEENWECEVTLLILSRLCTRLLLFSTSGNIHQACFDFLASLRSLSRRWVTILLEKWSSSTAEDDRNDLNRRILRMALVCTNTYDVGYANFHCVFSTDEATTWFIEISIIIHNHHHPQSLAGSPLTLIGLQLWQRLSYEVQASVSSRIKHSRNCLDQAVKTFWQAFTPGQASWTPLDKDTRAHVLISASAGGLPVSFDLLDASLLVDGCPLSRLPSEYQMHTTYSRLFGAQVLEIVPSDQPGMEFSATRKQNEWTVHFALAEGDLIIQTQSGNSIWEFIPPSKMVGDFPTTFVNSYSHWMNVDTGMIEFRPFKEPWKSGGDFWSTYHTGNGLVLRNGNLRLIDPKSKTAKVLAKVFKPIDDACFINIVLDTISSTLEIHICRYELSFTLEANDCALRSKNYHGMSIDQDQGIQSLVGLKNRIVLCPGTSRNNNTRVVIVPQGAVSSIIGKDGHPVTSILAPNSAQSLAVGYPTVIPRRNYDCFRVDTTLGRLLDNGSLHSKLLLCQLHTATSHCLPDRLTSRTGTEEALRILKSAAVVSFERLAQEDIEMLSDISLISPRRRFYPKHLRVMQDIQWHKVYDPLAQNDEFFQVAQSILRKAMSCEIMFPDEKSIEALKGTETDLAERALIRNSTFRVHGFGAEHYTSQHDTDYEGRDKIQGSILEQLERQVCQITRNLWTEQYYLLVQSSASPQTLYDVMGKKVDGVTSQSSIVTCRFESGWLDKPSISLDRKWCKVQQYLSCVDLGSSKYDLMAFFSALIFAQDADLQVIQVLLAFAYVPALRALQQPPFPIFELNDGNSTQTSKLEKCIMDHKRIFESCPEFSLQRRSSEMDHQTYNRRQQSWKNKVVKVSRDFASNLVDQWPIHVPTQPSGNDFTTYFDVPAAMPKIREYFTSWYKNRQLDRHLQTVISMVEGLEVDPVPVASYVASEMIFEPLNRVFMRTHIAASNLFSQSAPEIKCIEPSGFKDWCKASSATHSGSRGAETSSSQELERSLTDPLRSLLDSLCARAISKYQRDYVEELQESFKNSSLAADTRVEFRYEDSALQASLEEHVQVCCSQTESFQTDIFKCLRGPDDHSGFAFSSNSFPRLSPIFLLQQLNRHNWGKLPRTWRLCIVQWAISLTHLQRAQRMLAAVGHANELLKEMKNVGHDWDPMDFPESLLLEVESGLMIRSVQEKIAAPMRNCLKNSCMQLNMGEGKSSVIVPIVAAALANGKRLVRILVAKPQSKQMCHMLITKLGGLLDRQVFFLPFSRSTSMSSTKLQQIQRTLETCMETGGVLLVQPEQLLSFKLMGIEHVGYTGQTGGENHHYLMGTQLIKTQNFMEANARDIVDESDENFSVKFELIYTIGDQSAIEMSPDRWIVIQSVLSLVQRYAPIIKQSDPGGVLLEMSGHSGQFATLRILTDSAAQSLLQAVARHLCDNGIHGLAIGHQSPANREAVFAYITELSLTDEMARRIEEDGTEFFSDATKTVLLLLRGLFAGGVLAFALGQKRWRVNFGLTSRTPPTLLAVPYRAKDSPAPRADFSHPDIVITLTCLSYYYGGLSNDELDVCFEKLKRSDQAENEFVSWAESSPTLPETFRQLGGINLKDRRQCFEQVFPALKLSKAVIDFYLHTIVFPKEMVEFPKKLSASGWDLAKPTAHPVTGFSGTCDSKYVLPLDIQHLDLPEQSHTNATVLRCLLRPENLVKDLDADIDSISLLETVVKNNPSIDVILDVGALIIEMSNSEVARKWLELVKDAGKQAAIFVSDEDELLVANRQGFVEPLLTSPFASHTEPCLVFLDEAHTRGIDVRLPVHYRAATTLGPRLTKDRLAQACMRMRKLGEGQSVTFFMPHEIQQRIRSSSQMAAENPVTVADVLCWTVSETWYETERSIPLWALQGLRHQRQEIIWDTNVTRRNTHLALSSGDFDRYFEDEAMSLEQRYRPKIQKTSKVFAAQMRDPYLVARKSQVELIERKCERFGILSFTSATLQEEQERELAPEIEQERQTERPPRIEPLLHKLHPDVRSLVEIGTLRTAGGGFLAAFGSLNQSSAAQFAITDQFGRDLLVTADFASTVQLAPTSCSDAFHRSIQWILTLNRRSPSRFLVILSPWEANELLPIIKKSKHVYLHCYAPRPNLSFPTLQDLKLFSTPSLPPGWAASRNTAMQLSLFAADLYFETLDEYKEVCTYLGLSCVPNDGASSVAADGFVGRGATYPQCHFTQSPIVFLRTLMANIRRERQDISRTHVGRMLSGEILTEKEITNMVQE